MKKYFLPAMLALGICSGCGVSDQDNVALPDECSATYIQAFTEAVAKNDTSFCMNTATNPDFIDDGLGGYCFVSLSENHEQVGILHETSREVDCIAHFAQRGHSSDTCKILQDKNFPSTGIAESAYNQCIMDYASFVGDVTVCDLLEVVSEDHEEYKDAQECIKQVAHTTGNLTLCDALRDNATLYSICKRE